MRISVRPPASVSETTSLTSVPIRDEEVDPSASTASRGTSPAFISPPRIASSMSWFTYAIRSATRMICPSIVLARIPLARPIGAPDFVAVNNTLAVALKRRADVVLGLGTEAVARVGALGRVRREDVALAFFKLFADRHSDNDRPPRFSTK